MKGPSHCAVSWAGNSGTRLENSLKRTRKTLAYGGGSRDAVHSSKRLARDGRAWRFRGGGSACGWLELGRGGRALINECKGRQSNAIEARAMLRPWTILVLATQAGGGRRRESLELEQKQEMGSSAPGLSWFTGTKTGNARAMAPCLQACWRRWRGS